jgi:5-methylcytosine-specific restriction protein B
VSRVIPEKSQANQVLAAADEWKRACFVEDGSMFAEHPVWTAANFVSLTEHFVNNLDDGEDDFETKLERQLNPASPSTKQLMAEILWLLSLFPSNAGAPSKRQLISRVWNFSGQAMTKGSAYLSDDVLSGIGSAGTAYLTHRWREIRFLINAVREAKGLDHAGRENLVSSPWTFSEWLESVPDDGERQLEIILPFLLFPDSFERISSSADIRKILETIAGLDRADIRAMSKTDRAKAMLELRKTKEAELGAPIDFYIAPLRQQWKPSEPSPAHIPKPGGDGPTLTAEPPLNQILYGPPGTGKTFRTIERAVEILDPTLVLADLSRKQIKDRYDQFAADGLIRFVTFHQSFSYEDFVEGLRASTIDGNIHYSVADGVFKEMCQTTKAEARVPAGTVYSKDYEVLRSTPEILLLRKPNGSDLPLPWVLLDGLRTLVESGRITIEDIRNKTVYEKVPDSRLEKYIVHGYNNILPEIVASILADPSVGTSAPRRVIIIDEINRGNVSRIFGELITLLEPSKRAGSPEALSVTLPYSRQRFQVPNTLYLIGTMNTADRSLTSLDIALRRRFVFEEVEPDHNLLAGRIVNGIDVSRLLETINLRIERLLDRDHRLGHAYFIDIHSSDDLKPLREVFQRQILPLLQEYFFDDWERIRLVLNDHQKSDQLDQFVIPAIESEKWVNDGIESSKLGWRMNQKAFDRASSYLSTIGDAP